MSIEERIIKTACHVFNLPADDIKIDSRFKGGMSNYTYLIYVKNHPYVIRIIGEGGEHLVNPHTEKTHLKTIETLNISSDVVYFDVKTGIKVSKYVEGTPLSVEMSDEDYHDVAKILKKLHDAKLTGADYDLKGRLRRYEKLLKTLPSPHYYQLKMAWLTLYDNYYINYPKVLCHGDAQRSNIVKGNDKTYLLDWEFTGLNDPYYDIASFGNIDFKDAEKLLEIYLERKPSSKDYERIRFYRMYQVLQWHIVASYKHEIGLSEKLHLDFKMIAEKYLNFADYLLKLIKGEDV
ncbi:choline/ethanolamine kinase family protein [Acholeplasma granularum]|uniref:choline/ethanolamine kinase family protein n=1 Tax=Acholeplasma granularum TaxID=264635 RepID=UPI000470D94A|nr:choline/ethanolamine kinase family protein [Acholeplasma granularum]